MKELSSFRLGYFLPHAQRFGGGGKTVAPIVVPSAPAPAPITPPAPPPITAQPVAAPSPAATATSAEVIQAREDVRRSVARRKGFDSTIRAGNNGGWSGGNLGPLGNPSANTKLGQ